VELARKMRIGKESGMANDLVRFIHASQLDLDEPLVGTGPLTGEDRRLAEDATLLAFSRIIDACVDRAADFFLLTGNTFDGASLSLRAKSALESGLNRLAKNDIPAFVIPGVSDPVAAWNRLRLPDTVTVFDAEEEEPTDLVVDGRTLATIIPLAGASGEEAHWDFAKDALRTARGLKIGVVAEGAPVRWEATGPVAADRSSAAVQAASAIQNAIGEEIDYIGFGGGRVRRTLRLQKSIAHAPGCSQSRDRRGVGPHGCTLVEARGDRSIHHELIKLAPVRWESLPVEIRPGLAFDDLVQKMAAQLVEREAGKESLWLVNWIVRGSGDLFDQLGELKTQRELWEFLDEEVRTEGLRRHHILTREPPVEDSELETTGLFLEYVGAISDQLQPTAQNWLDRGKPLEDLKTPWVGNLSKVVHRLDPEHVSYAARRMARLWWT